MTSIEEFLGPPLQCGWCGRPIGGITGLDEVQNLIAHVAEHHNVTLDVVEAAELRNAWES